MSNYCWLPPAKTRILDYNQGDIFFPFICTLIIRLKKMKCIEWKLRFCFLMWTCLFHSSDRWVLFGGRLCALFPSCLSLWNVFYKHTEASCSSESSVLGNVLAPWWFGWQDSNVFERRSLENTNVTTLLLSRGLAHNHVVSLEILHKTFSCRWKRNELTYNRGNSKQATCR